MTHPVLEQPHRRHTFRSPISPESLRWWNIILCWVSFFAIMLLLLRTEPHFSSLEYEKDAGNEWTKATLPLSLSSEANLLRVHVTVSLEPIHPSHIRLTSSKCIDAMWIDGAPITALPPHFCPDNGLSILLSPYLHAGDNALALTIPKPGNDLHLNINPDRTDALCIVLELLATCIAVLGTILLYRAIGSPGNASLLFTLFGAGTVLRALYVFTTTYDVRSYDWVGHLDYVRYLLQHWSLPPPEAGWQFYHPPLYYFLASCWSAVEWFFGVREHITDDLQILSLFLSLVTLAISLWVTFLLFPKREQRMDRLLLGGMLTCFPSLVFISSRVSNDALLLPLLFVAFAFLLLWWRDGRPRYWLALNIAVALGILTKSNALPLLAIAWTCVLLKPAITRDEKVRLLFVSILTIAAMCAWLPIVRGTPGDTTLVGNFINHNLRVEPTPDALYTFNPWEILNDPYNNTWSDARRKYLWEFLFRSAFTGEFNFGPTIEPLVELLLAIGFTMLPLIVFGLVYRSWTRFRESIPLLVTFAVFVVSIFVFRILSPYSPSQDFRYIPLTVIPLGAYAIYGAHALPRWSKFLAFALIGSLSLASLALLVTLIARW